MSKNHSDTHDLDAHDLDEISDKPRTRLSSAQANTFLHEETTEVEPLPNELAQAEDDIEYSIEEKDAETAVQIAHFEPSHFETSHKGESLEESPNAERLHKLIARAGLASRRQSEEIIAQGRVLVNGIPVKEAGSKADPTRDRISVDGQPLRVSTTTTVVLMHKPLGVVSTRRDPEGRTTVTHLLPEKLKHLHPIGRLDYDTSGLLFLTDDGTLTQLLTHPSHGVEKVYWARVRGTVSVQTLKTLEAGIYLEDGKTAPAKARVRAQTENNALVQLSLREGRNRQVRRMLEAVGHPVRALRRVRVGGLSLDELLPGQYRVLLPGEVHALRKAADAKPKTRAKTFAPRAENPRQGFADNASSRPVSSRAMSQSSTSQGSMPQRPVSSTRLSSGSLLGGRAPSGGNISAPAPFERRANSSARETTAPRTAAPREQSKPRERDARATSNPHFSSAERVTPNSRFASEERAAPNRGSLHSSGSLLGGRVPNARPANAQNGPQERFSSSALTQRLARQQHQKNAQSGAFSANAHSANAHPIAQHVAQSFDTTARAQTPHPRAGNAPFGKPNASARPPFSGAAFNNSTSAASSNAASAKPGRQAKPTRPPKAARVFAATTAEAAKKARLASEKPRFPTRNDTRPTTSKPFGAKPFGAKSFDAKPFGDQAAGAKSFGKPSFDNASSPKPNAASGAKPRAKTDYSKPVARRGERPWGKKTRKRA